MQRAFLALFSVSFFLAGSLAAAPSGAAGLPAVSLRRGADLEATLRACEPALPAVVVAESSPGAARIREPLKDVPVETALKRISLDLDRCCLLRPRSLALQLRYGQPDAGRGPEWGELRQTVEDLEGLVQPFYPRLRDLGPVTRAHNAFGRSLTTAQAEKMQSGGLPLAALAPEQQRLFLEINTSHAYEDLRVKMHYVSVIMRNWKEGRIEHLTTRGMREEGMYLFVPNPEPTKLYGASRIPVRFADPQPWQGPPEVFSLPDPKLKSPASLRPEWTLPLQELDLETFARELRASGGPELEIEPFARQRRFWIASRAGTRGEILLALGDLWGWNLFPTSKGYRLGRARRPQAGNPRELIRQIRATVPPSLRYLLRSVRERYQNARLQRQGAAIDREAEQLAGPGWMRLPVTRLSEVGQEALAQVAVIMNLNDWMHSYAWEEEPLPWFTHPEKGILKLSGPLGPGRHPILMFDTFYEEGPRKGQTASWGWAVGTSNIPDE